MFKSEVVQVLQIDTGEVLHLEISEERECKCAVCGRLFAQVFTAGEAIVFRERATKRESIMAIERVLLEPKALLSTCVKCLLSQADVKATF